MSKREILFKGKCIDNGEWVEGDLIRDVFVRQEVKIDCAILYDFDFCEVIPETVGQYVGLKDKNGKMIFEGDLFVETDDEITYEVRYNNVLARYEGYSEYQLESYCFDEFITMSGDFPVMIVGNIHDKEQS